MSRIGLKTSYVSYNPRTDPPIFLGPRKEYVNEIINRMILTIETSRVLKGVFLGPFGNGKTQFAKYAMGKLDDVAHTIYVETPPCHRRTSFLDIHKIIMRRIGRHYILNLLKRANDIAQDNGSSLIDIIAIDDRDLSYIIETSLDVNDSLIWRFLSGEKLRSGDVKKLDVLSSQIYEDDAVWILNVISLLIDRFENKQLVIFLDEIENTAHIYGDSRVTFTEAIRGLVDENSYVGIIFLGSARGKVGLPLALTDEPVERRIGISNYFEFFDYTAEELRGLIRELLEYRRLDKENMIELMAGLENSGITVDSEYYPFSEEAIEEVINIVFKLREEGIIDGVRPKEALSIMDESIAHAIQQGISLINKEVIEYVGKRYLKKDEALLPQ
ncbi:MAG: hypothetical protein NWE89_15275 [Candidatus Bathyarchaeota archaeon]|nr:hypothetical protein [Candidatus Bathyarchaeota archaeon]